MNSNNPAEEQPYSYPITYHNYYEPYVILSSQRFIPYDERFRGYGMNKCIHLKGLHTHGATFHVITKYFVLAYTHERSLSHQVTYHLNSKLRRYIIAKLYQIACKELLLISSSPSPSSPTSGISLSSNTMTLLSNENSMNSYLSIQQFLMNSLKKYFIFSKTELEEKKKKTYWEVEIPRNLETTSN